MNRDPSPYTNKNVGAPQTAPVYHHAPQIGSYPPTMNVTMPTGNTSYYPAGNKNMGMYNPNIANKNYPTPMYA
jgi:hypothetical protein